MVGANSGQQGALLHSVCVCVCSRLTENSGEAKVTQFDDLMFGDEDVFWFDVSVDALNKHTDKMSANSRGQRSPSWFPASCRTLG